MTLLYAECVMCERTFPISVLISGMCSPCWERQRAINLPALRRLIDEIDPDGSSRAALGIMVHSDDGTKDAERTTPARGPARPTEPDTGNDS